MDVSLKNLVTNHILTPAEQSAAISPQFKIRNIAVFENNAAFFTALTERTLVFFPHHASECASEESFAILAAAHCAVVMYESDLTLFDTALQLSLPLFLMSEAMPLSKVIGACYHFAYSRVQRLAEVSLETMDKLSNELLNHKSEGSNMIQVATDLLECPVAFTMADFHLQQVKSVSQQYLVVNPLYTKNVFDWDLALASFELKEAAYRNNLAEGINGAKIGGYLYQNDYCRTNYCRLFIFPIAHGTNRYGYIFLSLEEKTKSLSPEMSVKVQQILAALKFEIIKADEIAHTINRYYDFLLDELIESDQTDFRKLMQKYGLVQKVVADEYYVVIAGRQPRNMQDAFFHELLTSQQFNLLYDHIVSVFGTINFFLFERKDCIVTLLPKQLVQDTAQGFLKLISVLQQFLKEQYQGVGISDAVITENVRQGYFQAFKALAVSQKSSDKKACFYSDLGILRFFFDHSNQIDFAPLVQVYQEYILPIIEYDASHSGELFSTLTTYIACASSPSNACAALFIHKNTLYSRLAKIAQVIGKNLSDSESMFHISLGIKIHTLIQTGMLYPNFDP